MNVRSSMTRGCAVGLVAGTLLLVPRLALGQAAFFASQVRGSSPEQALQALAEGNGPLPPGHLFSAAVTGTPAGIGHGLVHSGPPPHSNAGGLRGPRGGPPELPILHDQRADQLPAAVVPEPVSMVLIGTGLAGIGLAARRRRRIEDADHA